MVFVPSNGVVGSTGYCTCEDGTFPNSLGYCCPGNEVFIPGSNTPGLNDGICGCPQEN